MFSSYPSLPTKSSIAGNFIHTTAAMPGDYIGTSNFFVGCLVQNLVTSFEFYILKIYLVCWFPTI